MTLSTIKTIPISLNELGFIMVNVIKENTIDFVLQELSNKTPIMAGTNKVYTVITTDDGYVGMAKRSLTSGRRDEQNYETGITVAAIRLARYLYKERKDKK